VRESNLHAVRMFDCPSITRDYSEIDSQTIAKRELHRCKTAATRPSPARRRDRPSIICADAQGYHPKDRQTLEERTVRRRTGDQGED